MPALENADTAFAPRAPFLEVFEPALLLILFPLLAGTSIGGYGNAFYSQLLGSHLIAGREKPRIGRKRLRRNSKLLYVLLQRGKQQGRIRGPFLQYFVMRDELILDLLELD